MISRENRQALPAELCLVLLAVVGTVAGAASQEMGMEMGVVTPVTPPAAEQPSAVSMTVRPMATARPALRHLLLPDLLEQTPGNALPLYFLAIDLMEDQEGTAMSTFGEKLVESLDRPLAELRSDETRSLLERHREVLAQVTLAARRENCVWDMPIREQGILVPLRSLSRFRPLARLVALQARIDIAENRHADACRTVQTGLAMARHVSQGPTVINALVAVVIAESALERIPELLQNADAPNLFWALADLPRPLIDMRIPLQFERSCLLMTFPQLRTLADARLTPEEAQKLLDDVIGLLGPGDKRWQTRVRQAAVVITLYPAAREHLMSLGYGPEHVQAMPAVQAILLHWLEQYTGLRDDVFKWCALPYWQADEGLRAAEMRLQENPDHLANPFVAFLPPLQKARFMTTVPDRRIAALGCIEAIRLHVAAHDGRPPKRLEDITLVPVPIDPITGEPFRYEVDANRFVLEGPVPEGLSPGHGLRYEVTLAQ